MSQPGISDLPWRHAIADSKDNICTIEHFVRYPLTVDARAPEIHRMAVVNQVSRLPARQYWYADAKQWHWICASRSDAMPQDDDWSVRFSKKTHSLVSILPRAQHRVADQSSKVLDVVSGLGYRHASHSLEPSHLLPCARIS